MLKMSEYATGSSRPTIGFRHLPLRSSVPVFLLLALSFTAGCSGEADNTLPIRPGPRTETTFSVPHVQASVRPVPEVDAALRQRIAQLPGVSDRETIVSVAGTRALWLDDGYRFSDPAATLRDREFAHIHPDGSLHAVLPRERALEATAAKWAELHPWVGREDFWDGMVMLYTPQTLDELETTWQLIVDSYNFVTGQQVEAASFD